MVVYVGEGFALTSSAFFVLVRVFSEILRYGGVANSIAICSIGRTDGHYQFATAYYTYCRCRSLDAFDGQRGLQRGTGLLPVEYQGRGCACGYHPEATLAVGVCSRAYGSLGEGEGVVITKEGRVVGFAIKVLVCLLCVVATSFNEWPLDFREGRVA